MSITQLFIGYAHKSCSPEQVKDAFEGALNESGIVSKVDVREKTNQKGETFKIFFIHFERTNRQLEHMLEEIKRHNEYFLTYERFWDKKKWNYETESYGMYNHHFWKVVEYKKKEQAAPVAFVPRLMTRAEAETAGISAPKPVVPKNAAKPVELKQDSPKFAPAKAAAVVTRLTTDELYSSNLDWDSHSDPETKLPPVPSTPPQLRRSPSTAKEYGMPPAPKRRRSIDDVENAFAALGVNDDSDEETEEPKLVADELTLAGFGLAVE